MVLISLRLIETKPTVGRSSNLDVKMSIYAQKCSFFLRGGSAPESLQKGNLQFTNPPRPWPEPHLLHRACHPKRAEVAVVKLLRYAMAGRAPQVLSGVHGYVMNAGT